MLKTFYSRQFRTFILVGLMAAFVHYGILLVLVEVFKLDPVPATLTGYIIATFVSYQLNRHYTYQSDRPHREAFWRFCLVATSGFVLTGLLMSVLTKGLDAPYLPSQILTTGIVLFWHFIAHKIWTFRM